jgi:glycosyltransferase involved in cell wall biosynthesis
LKFRLKKGRLPRNRIRHEGVKLEQVVIIPNGIDITAYEEPADSNSIRAELGIDDDGFVVGAVGRLNIQKGFSDLIGQKHNVRYKLCQ